MDSQESQAGHHHHHHHPPPQLHSLPPHHQYHHPHHHQQPPSHTHPMMAAPPHHPPPQQQQQNQQPQQTNSYVLANNVPIHNNTAIMQQQQNQNPGFPFNSMLNSGSGQKPSLDYSDGSSPRATGFSIEPARKKRGRPRKYSPDGNIALGLSPTPVTPISSSAIVVHTDSGGGGGGVGTPGSDNASKKARGRPSSTGKKQLDALGAAGVGFTPHVITVNVGEDIAAKVMAFSQQGPRTVCILSANGAICNVTLRQPALCGGTVSYEGRYEIISLSGSLVSESNDSHSRSAGLCVSLAGSDGRVLGGGVSGVLMAATPVQVIVGSFIAEGKKPKSKAPSSAPPSNMLNFGAPPAGASPPSHEGASSDSSDEDGGSPLSRGGPGPYGNSGQTMHGMQMYSNMGWPNNNV